MFSVQWVGDRELIGRLEAMPKQVRDALYKRVQILRLRLEGKIKSEKLSGQVLHVRTGRLRASIFSEATQTDTSVTGRAASSGDVKYGAIHEFGGKTPPHEIVATKAQALSFVMNGKQTFFKSVHHPGSVMPERSFMRSALSDMKDEIIDSLNAGVSEGIQK